MTVQADLDLIRERLKVAKRSAPVPHHYTQALAALSRLQRLLQEQEEALAQARECCARPPGVCFPSGRSDAA